MDPPIRRAAAVAALLPAGEQVARTALLRRAAAFAALLPAGEQVARPALLRRAAAVAPLLPAGEQVARVFKVLSTQLGHTTRTTALSGGLLNLPGEVLLQHVDDNKITSLSVCPSVCLSVRVN